MPDNNDFKERIKFENPDQQDLNDKMMSLLDEYEKSNSFENREFLCYLSAAIFLTYKKLYPQLSIYILFRTKSDASFIKNINKEFGKFMENLDNDLPFDTSSITKDISGLKIILDNINFSLPSKGNLNELFSDPEISELLEKSNNDLKFIAEVDEFLKSSIQNCKTYYELKNKVLEKIIDITPKEFTDERKPELSFEDLYKDTKYHYEYFSENDSFPTSVSDSEINTLNDLLNDFRSRVHDPLQFSILRKTLPIVFEDPLIKNVLKTSSSYEKESLKKNAFQAIYYNLSTPFGNIEAMSQSNKAHYSATKGSAFHSGIPGKSINVKDFFELVNPNDKHDISYYLDTLDSISADSMISPYEIPEFENEEEKNAFFKTPKGTAFLESEKYREMMKHIRIKQNMLILPQHVSKDLYLSTKTGEVDEEKIQEALENGTISSNTVFKPTIVETNEYLLSSALSLSPYMNVCSSGHSSYTTAEIHHKKIIGEFAEVLRKKDSNTCLRDMLIRRLENIIETEGYKESTPSTNPRMKYCLDLVKRHDEISVKLPKDISTKNIISYAEKLRLNDQSISR